MTNTIGIPVPDCNARRSAAEQRGAERDRIAAARVFAATTPNGEETSYDLSYALNFHKGLPHTVNGFVHGPSYVAMVRMLCAQEYGSIETLPVGANRTVTNGSDTNPSRYAVARNEDETATPPKYNGYRKLTSPFTGHAYDTQGADSGSLSIAPAPLVASDELAAEMAEVYLMALLRDQPFPTIAAGLDPALAALVTDMAAMPWFAGPDPVVSDKLSAAERRRFESRGELTAPEQLFRGSTPGSKLGPLLSQFMLIGSDNTKYDFKRPDGAAPGVDANSEFPGRRAEFGREDGYVLFGAQIIDQRSIAAIEGVDYLTNWAAWIDCQNGADFNDIDVFRSLRRFITTPRDLATYVHYDALYQAYLVACLTMLSDSKAFPKDRGMPETSSRSRAAFASWGGPHVLSMLTEVATRALKAVWRQKWMHHRRTRPEVIAGLLTLNANQPDRIENKALKDALTTLQTKIPASILDAIATHNTAQNVNAAIKPKSPPSADLPGIIDAKNFLLPLAFPEGSPTHPAYGAGHATVAGACVTVLKAFFEMFDDAGAPRAWPFPEIFQPAFTAPNNSRLTASATPTGLTVEGELDKLAGNIAIARNMAGVHYYTDYYESVRLGERVAASIIEEHLSKYGEPVTLSFTSFDGEKVRISSNGDRASVRVVGAKGVVPADTWYENFAA